MVVNGGGSIIINIQKDGFLPIQRNIVTGWEEYFAVPQVTMIASDPTVNPLSLSSIVSTESIEGSTVVDDDGERTAKALFAPNTTAYMVMKDGSKVALDDLNIRFTEYTVGESGPSAMPGDLPFQSAYTYAVEISDDYSLEMGAKTIEFSKPIVFHLDNFLDFPVGITVPVGYYDRELAAWVPSENGRVIKILNISEGKAILDLDGDEAPDDEQDILDLGIDDDELVKIAEEYDVGKTFWRTRMSHLTPWDCNNPWGLPVDAGPPGPSSDGGTDTDVDGDSDSDTDGDSDSDTDGDSDSDTDGDTDEDEDCYEDDWVCEPKEDEDLCEQKGSIIRCNRQVLGHRVPITGTPFNLVYDSSLTDGYRSSRSLGIKLTGNSVHEALQRVDMIIEVAGRKYVYSDDDNLCSSEAECYDSFPPIENQKFIFVWDGKDKYGRDLYGEQKVKISIGNVFPGFYWGAPSNFPSFGWIGDQALYYNKTRKDITLWYRAEESVNRDSIASNKSIGIGGWRIDAQKIVDREILKEQILDSYVVEYIDEEDLYLDEYYGRYKFTDMKMNSEGNIYATGLIRVDPGWSWDTLIPLKIAAFQDGEWVNALKNFQDNLVFWNSILECGVIDEDSQLYWDSHKHFEQFDITSKSQSLPMS